MRPQPRQFYPISLTQLHISRAVTIRQNAPQPLVGLTSPPPGVRNANHPQNGRTAPQERPSSRTTSYRCRCSSTASRPPTSVPLVADQSKQIQGRRSAREAWAEWSYIEGNPPHAYSVMLFDIDDPDRWEYDVDGPIPNWQVRKDSQPTTYHVAFALENPVARHDAARLKPLRYFREVYEGLSVIFGADYRYSGLMTKNPLHPPEGCSTQWFRAEPYTLHELRDWLPRVIPKPVIPTGVGRNEDLFRFCVKLAHQPKWARTIAREGYAGQWLAQVRILNIQQWAENPLPDSECRSIAKSCAKYSLRQFNEGIFSDIQTARNTRRWHPGQPGYDYQGRANGGPGYPAFAKPSTCRLPSSATSPRSETAALATTHPHEPTHKVGNYHPITGLTKNASNFRNSASKSRFASVRCPKKPSNATENRHRVTERASRIPKGKFASRPPEGHREAPAQEFGHVSTGHDAGPHEPHRKRGAARPAGRRADQRKSRIGGRTPRTNVDPSMGSGSADRRKAEILLELGCAVPEIASNLSVRAIQRDFPEGPRRFVRSTPAKAG